MAVQINKYVEWRAGAGTPVKYSFSFVGETDIVSVSGSTATVYLRGTATVSNHPYNSQNSFAASDISALCPGDKDIWNYQFSPNTAYYQTNLPCAPNAPAGYQDSILVEFRGDTYITDGPNRSSLFVKGDGMVLNQLNTEDTRSFTVDQTFTITLSGDPNQQILTWVSSGANSSTDYSWYMHEAWATLAEFDYRPGKIWNGSSWQSHNRSGGAANLYNGSTWNTMRTTNGGTGTDNPPLIRYSSSYKNMRKIGDNA